MSVCSQHQDLKKQGNKEGIALNKTGSGEEENETRKEGQRTTQLFVNNDEVGRKQKLRQRLCTSQEDGRSSQQKLKKKKKCFGKAKLGGVRGSSTLKDGTSDKKEKTYMRLSKQKQKLREINSMGKTLRQNQVESQQKDKRICTYGSSH